MPIGKQSINRVAKKADTEEIKPVAAEQPEKAKKPPPGEGEAAYGKAVNREHLF